MAGITLAQYWGDIEPWAVAVAVVAPAPKTDKFPAHQWDLFMAKTILPPDEVRQRAWDDRLRKMIAQAEPLALPWEETIVVMGMVCPCQDAERLSMKVTITGALLEQQGLALNVVGRAIDTMVTKYRTHLEREAA